MSLNESFAHTKKAFAFLERQRARYKKWKNPLGFVKVVKLLLHVAQSHCFF